MQIGHLAVSLPTLIFLLAVFVALSVASVMGKRGGAVERDVAIVIGVGLMVARVAFVGRHFADYRDPFSILDIRDVGFDAMPGLIAAAFLTIWRLATKRAHRLPAICALLAGVAVYGGGQVLAPQIGRAGLPQATLPTTNNETELISTSGKPTVVNLWATWCPPCQAELPVFAQMQREVPGVNFIFLNEDTDTSRAGPYLEARGLRLNHSLLDIGGTVAAKLSAKGYPTTLFYDRTGRLVATHLGPFSRATLSDALKHLYLDV